MNNKLEKAYSKLEEKGKLEIPFLPIDEYTDFFLTKGYEIDEDSYESNGHEHDFWISYTHPTLKTITIEGCLFYGGNKMYYENDNSV